MIDDEAGLPCNSSDDAVKQSSGECLAITSSETSRGIPSESCKFDSLNPLTGNNFQTVNLPTNTPPISLSYNSIDGTWRHNYSSRLEIGKNIISRTDSTGQTSFFQIKNNTATSRNGLDKLRKIGQTWQHTNKNNQTFVYDLAGTLIEIQDKTRIQTLVYNKNQITITQKNTPPITIEELIDGQPISITYNSHRYYFAFNSNNRLIETNLQLNGATPTSSPASPTNAASATPPGPTTTKAAPSPASTPAVPNVPW
ncbi:hypothetical protein PSGK_10660 [Pseudomonas solani]|uniref:hypothetical protein n=1 Tax=Pseudomonas solani TaxID=2731552 RepID=UPI0035BE68EC